MRRKPLHDIGTEVVIFNANASTIYTCRKVFERKDANQVWMSIACRLALLLKDMQMEKKNKKLKFGRHRALIGLVMLSWV